MPIQGSGVGRRVQEGTEFDPLGNGDTLAARSLACYVIDRGNRLHFLRRRDQGSIPSREVFIGGVSGRRVR